MSDSEEEIESIGFHEMGLDDRILKAIAKLGWSSPTLIQEKAIPLALEGKDLMARARTGSGKTAAYAIPLIQKILHSKQTATVQSTKALVLTPTRELCNQAYNNIRDLSSSCSREVKCVDISGQAPLDAHKPLLMEKPDIIIATPSRIMAHIKAGNLELRETVEMVVIDEADLVFSFGYEADVKSLLQHLPQIYQAFLMSATLSDDVKSLKKLILHNPVILKLEEPQLPETSQLTQYHIKCEEDDKFALLYTLLKLRLIRGKSIVFVNSIDKCYRLKLFLAHFGITACVLNSELPVNSRCHIVTQFNSGLYDIVLAADETTLSNPTVTKKGKSKKKKVDAESGVSRGIDFHNVSNVVNFDFPGDVDSYVHRVGRTARGVSTGTALSFVSIREMKLLKAVEKSLHGDSEGGSIFKPFNFKMEEIEGFRYRAKDALRACTKVAVKEARLKEIRQEALNSEKLKAFFEDNPRDYQVLRHDKGKHMPKGQQHLKNVPEYLVPETLKHLKSAKPKLMKHKTKPWRKDKLGMEKRAKARNKATKRKADPLTNFQFAGLSHMKKKKK